MINFHNLQIIVLFSLIFTVITISANEESTTSFAVGKYASGKIEGYADNLRLSKILTIPYADELEIVITGKIEKCCQSNIVTRRCCDYLTIFDSHNKEIGKFSGMVDTRFTVKGSSIRVAFKSDGRTTDEGALVRISAWLPANAFKEIKSQFLAATTQILKQGAKEAYDKISHNLHSFKILSNKINTQEIDNITQEFTRELIATGQTYKEIAVMDESIMKSHQQQFDIIKSLKKKTLDKIEAIEKQQQKYRALHNDAQSKLIQLDNHLEKQKWQISLDSFQSIVKTLSVQQKIWNRLYEVQKHLEPKLYIHSQRIGLLLHVLDLNARIYEQSANVVLLRKTVEFSPDNFIDVSKLKGIVNDIKTSENDIKQLIKQIEKTEFSNLNQK